MRNRIMIGARIHASHIRQMSGFLGLRQALINAGLAVRYVNPSRQIAEEPELERPYIIHRNAQYDSWDIWQIQARP